MKKAQGTIIGAISGYYDVEINILLINFGLGGISQK